MTPEQIEEELETLASYYGNDFNGNETKEHKALTAAPPEDAKAFKRVAIELRIRFPVEIQYNSEFEAIVKRLEGGSL